MHSVKHEQLKIDVGGACTDRTRFTSGHFSYETHPATQPDLPPRAHRLSPLPTFTQPLAPLRHPRMHSPPPNRPPKPADPSPSPHARPSPPARAAPPHAFETANLAPPRGPLRLQRRPFARSGGSVDRLTVPNPPAQISGEILPKKSHVGGTLATRGVAACLPAAAVA